LYARVISQHPLATGADSVPVAPCWVGTTNFNMRKPNFVIIHHTAQKSCPQTLQTFTQTRTQVSAHYVICKDGTEPFSAPQINSLLHLLTKLKTTYNIPAV